ncbi:MAG: helix-turn-helix domain-containing protein [Pseudonocardiaceae bacterium]
MDYAEFVPDPALWQLSPMRAALAHRDVSAVYRMLIRAGITQRRIAELTGQLQSEISEIIRGRQVVGYDVLARICIGLGIPRGYMGLAYDENSKPRNLEEATEDMKRRALLASGSIVLLGSPVLGEVLEIPVRPDTPTPLPSRLTKTDVTALQNLTEALRTGARTYGGGGQTISEIAYKSLPLLSVPAADSIEAELASTLAALHTLAGWTCVDSGLHDNARYNFAKAIELAKLAGDDSQLAAAWRHAGIQMIDAGAHNDGLKAYQLGLIADGDGTNAKAWLTGESAIPLAAMGHRDAAVKAISVARENPMASDFDDADMDYLTAAVYHRLGEYDTAESFAATSVRKWAAQSSCRRDSMSAEITLAAIHTITGQADSATLAHRAITGITQLSSIRAKTTCLQPLINALDSSPRGDNRDLAHLARQVATMTDE